MFKKQLENSVLLALGVCSLTREAARSVTGELGKQTGGVRKEVKKFTEDLTERGRQDRRSLRRFLWKKMEARLKDVGLATQSDIEAMAAQISGLRQRIEAPTPPEKER
jgi:polyhydroxyalkanoate synthesis regulator phasin